MFLNRLVRTQPVQWLWIGLVIMVAIVLMVVRPALSTSNQFHGSSILYGKVSDTRHWYDTHGHNLVAHAKVTINSLPPQITYTDDQGQFRFEGLRDIKYRIAIENPQETNKAYTFVTRVEGRTGQFYDLASDEKHNLKEMDY
ncbi:carboxypeptidase regulatory-like domain-containing protein [Oculatella sp. LEGE 06141]|uniref:carboxypeptidase-like regulatory domain-containing protein n=1 Tax=Oculatella sp. LEGE 06141 TaxID=1828648 RepID=UPI00187ED7A2|nr:carboxypeptidase-like regulatory domain-containing protein [Oculatella sp. LEGE 06141]MBE9178766.1 carboxypeptidase regulatory-like domain-containing protein [Oculatella sp. LEGE 06141]